MEKDLEDDTNHLKLSINQQLFLYVQAGKHMLKILNMEAATRLVELKNGPDQIPEVVRNSCATQLSPGKNNGLFWRIAVSDWKDVVILIAEERAMGRKEKDHGFSTPSGRNDVQPSRPPLPGPVPCCGRMRSHDLPLGEYINRFSAPSPETLDDFFQVNGHGLNSGRSALVGDRNSASVILALWSAGGLRSAGGHRMVLLWTI